MAERLTSPVRSASTRIVGMVHTQMRRMRSLTSETQRDERVRQLAKHELTTHAAKAVERVRALVIDAVDRGSPLEECEEVLQLLLADVRAAYAAKHGAQREMTLAEAHQAEEVAEGEKEAAETAYAYAKTPANATRLLIAVARHRRADEVYEAIVRAQSLALG